jgi:hypothetical protein
MRRFRSRVRTLKAGDEEAPRRREDVPWRGEEAPWGGEETRKCSKRDKGCSRGVFTATA